MKKIQLFFFLLVPLHLFAQVRFSPEIVLSDFTSRLHNAVQIEMVDFNGDGLKDIFHQGRGTDQTKWLKQTDANGSYSLPIPIDIYVQNNRKLQIEDLDQDGFDDLLLTLDGEIVWYKNDGTGDFSTKIILADNLENNWYALVMDFDNDGDNDIISSGVTGLIVFENIGNEVFENVSTIDESGGLHLTPFDVDEDGYLDIISTPANGNNASWYRNESGAGTFTFMSDFGSVDYAVEFKMADINSDGLIDVVGRSEFNDKLFWYPNLGSTNFGNYIEIDSYPELYSFDVGDLNGDNQVDIQVSIYDGRERTGWLENEDGLGTFGEIQSLRDDINDQYLSIIDDVDQDGDLDILSVSNDRDYLTCHKNLDGQASFEMIRILETVTDPLQVKFIDLDNDGDSDIVFGSLGEIAWYENLDGHSRFSTKKKITYDVNYINFISFADIDNDGDLDLLAAESNNDILWFRHLDGKGNFSDPIELNTQPLTHSEGGITNYAADFDGDGDLDLVSSAFYLGDGNVSWYENMDGQGTFSDQRIIDDGEFYFGYATPFDFDNDGDMDIIATRNEPNNQLVWYENINGQADWSSHQVINADNGFLYILPVDIDKDGDLDITMVRDTGKIFLMENKNGILDDIQQIIDTDGNTQNLEWADINGDGFLDCVTTTIDFDHVSWHENLNNGFLFGPPIIIADETQQGSVSQLRGLAVADLGNDGDMDVVYTFPAGNKISLRRNLLNEPIVSGNCFLDDNENGVFDNGEPGLLNHVVFLDPDEILSFSLSNGNYNFSVDNGNYNIYSEADSLWTFSTPDNYDITVMGNYIDNLNFGLKPNIPTPGIVPEINAGRNRCGFEVPFWIDLINTGNTYESGLVSFTTDALTNFVQSDPLPDSISGNTLFWYFDEIIPSYSDQIELTLKMPSEDFDMDTVRYNTVSYIYNDQGNLIENLTEEYVTTISCAIDPNDKLVDPPGLYEEHLTMFDVPMFYTIRFQNTGSDTAFTVRIEDFLDENLDWQTFRPITASHPYEAKRLGNGMVEFTFENILLPDSTTNLIESQGFVKYVIQQKEGLPEYTRIENEAAIFFDFNQPIITNTVFNTLASSLVSGYVEIDPNKSIRAYPNPFEDQLIFSMITPGDQISGKLTIQSISGQLMAEKKLDGQFECQFQTDWFPKGVYIYQIQMKNGAIIQLGKLVKI